MQWNRISIGNMTDVRGLETGKTDDWTSFIGLARFFVEVVQVADNGGNRIPEETRLQGLTILEISAPNWGHWIVRFVCKDVVHLLNGFMTNHTEGFVVCTTRTRHGFFLFGPGLGRCKVDDVNSSILGGDVEFRSRFLHGRCLVVIPRNDFATFVDGTEDGLVVWVRKTNLSI